MIILFSLPFDWSNFVFVCTVTYDIWHLGCCFKGMNPEVETLMRNEGKSEVEENDDENAETSVTDEDMANQ